MAVSVLCLFLTVPWIGLQCVIAAFPDHIHFWTFGSHPSYVSYEVNGVKKVGSAVHHKIPNH